MSILMTRTTAGNIMIKKSQSVYASYQQQAKALNLDVMWCDVPKWCDFFFFHLLAKPHFKSWNHGVCVLKLMCSACVLACMRACAYKIENWATRRDTVNDMHGANIYFEIKVKSLLNMELFLSFLARFSSFNSHFHIRVLFELPESSYPKCIFWWLVFSTIHNK